MSSILDALKKVEQERSGKTQQPMESVHYSNDYHDLMHDAVPSTGGPRTISITPTTMVAGTVAFGIVMVALSVAFSLMLTSHSSGGSELTQAKTASAAPSPSLDAKDKNTRVASYTGMMQPAEQRPATQTKSTTPAVEKPVTAIQVPPVAAVPSRPDSSEPAAVTASAPVSPSNVSSIAPEQAVDAQPPPKIAARTEVVKPADEAVTREKPAQVSVPGSAVPHVPKASSPQPVKVAKVEPSAAPPTQEQPAANTDLKPPGESSSATDTADIPVKPSGAINFEALPRFSESERLRLGMQKLKINIVGLASKRQPNPSAYINLNKVYVGETIPGTNARLIGVDLHGVAIQVDGQKYFLENNR